MSEKLFKALGLDGIYYKRKNNTHDQMYSIKSIFLAILGLNVLCTLFIGIHFRYEKRNATEATEVSFLQEVKKPSSPYKFDDPAKAYFFLEKLDVFEAVGQLAESNYSLPVSGFKINNNYCQEHRAYIVNHPEIIFENLNLIMNHYPEHKLRSQVVPALGANDIHPEVTVKDRKSASQFKYDMRLDATIFFMYNVFHRRREVGRQYSCTSQASNSIPGNHKMTRKDFLGQALVEYSRKYTDKPHCFNFKKQFPKTWILAKEDQCRDFFAEFNSEVYQELKKERKMVYFRKIGAHVHEGKGVFPVTDEEEVYLNNLYENGTKCGQVRENNLIQYNVHNLLLVHNRKFGFRIFMLVASTNPLLVYYHDGYARLSLNEYDPKSKEIITFVTNIGQNIKEAEKRTGLTEQEIQEFTLWRLEDFHDHMIQQGLVTDPNWINNHLRAELKKTMIHLIRMTQSAFFRRSSVFELYGLDFVMDEDMNLWFIECNTTPLLQGFTEKSTKLLNQMLADTLEIELGLVRSRMKRIINYINYLSKELDYDSFMKSLSQRKEEFKNAARNRFEPEFEPRPENNFHKIIDEREQGTKRYSELIPADCL